MLLIDAVLSILNDGDTVSARKVSRLLGEDQTRVLRLLERLTRQGVLRSKTVCGHNDRDERPYEIFTPVGPKVAEAIKERTSDGVSGRHFGG